MSSDIGLAWFRIAVFITLVSGILILLEPRDSAEFVVSVMSFVLGLIFMGIVAIIARRSSH